MLVIDPTVREFFIPDSEKDKDRPAEFELTGLTAREKLRVFARVQSEADASGADVIYEVLAMKCSGWRNVRGADGADLAFRRELLDHLDSSLVVELYTRIMELSTLSAETAGN